MKTREELIDEMAKAIYATGIALDGTDYAFGVHDDDDHFHRMASALIAANIGDVTEYKEIIRDLNTDVVAYRALCKADDLEQIIEGQKSLIDEYKHRAEVAEKDLERYKRALCCACKASAAVLTKELVKARVDCFLQQAKREIEEEKGE